MSGQPFIRLYAPTDLAALTALHNSVFPSKPLVPERLLDFIAHGPSIIYVAEADKPVEEVSITCVAKGDEAVGGVGGERVAAGRVARLAGFAFAWLAADELQLIDIGVDVQQRRRGIAQALLNRLMEHGREAGARRISLDVRENNAEAVAFYLKNGFQKAGRRKDYYPDGVDGIFMAKRLQEKLMP